MQLNELSDDEKKIIELYREGKNFYVYAWRTNEKAADKFCKIIGSGTQDSEGDLKWIQSTLRTADGKRIEATSFITNGG